MLFYNIGIQIYYLLIKVSSAFNDKAKLWLVGRKNIFEKITEQLENNSSPIAWFHCASLGEFEQARPVIEKFRREFSQYKIFLTFFSPSGYEIRKNYSQADYVFYLPLDTPKNANNFVNVVNPKIALFVKYEFWHHYIAALQKKNIPVISFSAIFRENQAFFKPYGNFYKKILQRFNKIFVQNEKSVELLNSIGILHAEVGGDTRFDRVKEISLQKKNIPIVEKFKGGRPTIIIGSAWKEDLNLLIPYINKTKNIKIIIAPHEIKETEISDIEKNIQLKVTRFSTLKDNSIDTDVLIIDNIGMLSNLYQYADIAYIGGAFGKGLHNIIEAATFGMPIIFGPKYQKFQEAKDLIRLEVAYPVKNYQELEIVFNELLSNTDKRKRISKISLEYIDHHIGATDKIINFCKTLIFSS